MKSAVAALLAAALLACGATGGLDAYGDLERSPTAIQPPLLPDAAAARSALEAGDTISARKILERLCERAPKDLGLAVMLQEAELAGGEKLPALRARYLARARERNDANSWVLAARLEGTRAEALAILESAARLDPTSVWPPYGLAFFGARDGAWSEAQVHLKRALELDPAHLPSRRLEAALLARDGKFDEARSAYGAWLEASKDDPRVDPQERVAAQLDLALVELESGRADSAKSRLAALPDTADATGFAGRRLCLIAATEQSLGHFAPALLAARQAEAISPESALPKVQQALLNEQWLEDPAAAKAAWGRVLEGARSSGDLSNLIQSMRARVVLERLGVATPPVSPSH